MYPEEYKKQIDKGIVPESNPLLRDYFDEYREDLPDYHHDYGMKTYCGLKGMFPRLSMDAIEHIYYPEMKNMKVLEIMAGTGWLAQGLQRCGLPIIATDIFKSKYRYVTEGSQLVFAVEKLSAIDAITDYGENCDALLVSWPYMENDLVKALLMTNWPSSKPILYVGEGYGGCTADDEFHDRFVEKKVIDIPQWSGLHDRLRKGYIA